MGLRLVALSFELLVFSKRRRAICPSIIECASRFFFEKHQGKSPPLRLGDRAPEPAASL